MLRRDVEGLDPTRAWWVAAIVSPERDWPGAPGCRRGARFMVEGRTFHASRDEFEAFASRGACLEWVLGHRDALNRALPGVTVRAVRLDRWLLGLD